jgi:hypothetical protein
MESLFEKENKIKRETSRIKDSLKAVTEEMELLQEEITQLEQWSENNPAVPSVKAFGSMTAGTHVKGRYCATVLERPVRNAAVKETKADEDGDREKSSSAWQMRVVPLT